jgi:Leucine-rich repeat (LRR) protein
LKSLDLLILPQSFRSLPEEELTAIGALRAHPTLKNIQTEYRSTGGWVINTTQPKDIFWQDWDREQTFVPALRKSGIQFSLQKLPSGSYGLDANNQPLWSLSILKGVPISRLAVVACQVTDLTPLRDLPLEFLDISHNPITDLSPLQGKQIKELYLTSAKVSDLSPLTNLPLKNLYLGDCPNVTNVAALAEIPTLENVIVPWQAANIESLRKLPKLARLSYQFGSGGGSIPDTTVAEFWKAYDGQGWMKALRESDIAIRSLEHYPDGTWRVDLSDTKITDLKLLKGAPIGSLTLNKTAVGDLSPLRGMPITMLMLNDTRITDLGPLQGMRIKHLEMMNTRVADLSALRGMPLDTLQLGGTAIADLQPLRGMSLKSLWIFDTEVSDLRPLEGMPIHLLHLSGTKVKDLSVVHGMPLTYLRLHNCNELTDISPLADCKELNTATLPPNARNFEFLRALRRTARSS